MRRRMVLFLTWFAVAGGTAAVGKADGPSIPVTPDRTDAGRIKVVVSLTERRYVTVVVYNQEDTTKRPSLRAWLVICDGRKKYVAGVEVVGKAFHAIKNATSYSFTLSPEYRANTTFNLSLPPKADEPEAPVYQVLLGEFEKERIEAQRNGDPMQ